MKEMKRNSFFRLGMLAFAGLGLEIVLMTLEGMIYGGNSFREWGIVPTLAHWTMTCILWGGMAYYLYQTSKKEGFDLLSFRARPTVKRIGAVLVLMIICLIISYLSWGNAFKPVAEFTSKTEAYGQYGWIAYLFQYSYYWVESMLVVLIIGFGQKSGEEHFHMKWAARIPWGGIMCGVTWGLVHMFSKGSLTTGITACFCAILYGVAYLLLGKNVRYAYPIIALMFML